MSLCLSPSTCATVPTLTPSEVTTFHPCSICSHETGSVMVDHASTAKTHAHGLGLVERGRRSAPVFGNVTRPLICASVLSSNTRKAKVGQKFRRAEDPVEAKGPVSGAFPVAGAGFEPATS